MSSRTRGAGRRAWRPDGVPLPPPPPLAAAPTDLAELAALLVAPAAPEHAAPEPAASEQAAPELAAPELAAPQQAAPPAAPAVQVAPQVTPRVAKTWIILGRRSGRVRSHSILWRRPCLAAEDSATEEEGSPAR